MSKADPVNFDTEPQRRQWIINNADYFTTVSRRNRRNERDEWPTLEKAKKAAQRIVYNHPDRTVMIYAVKGVHDTWVCNVRRDDATGCVDIGI